MQFIKQCWQSGENKWAMVRTNSYQSSLGYIQELVAEAKRDYPELVESIVQVKVYDGAVAKRMTGIEFPVPYLSDQYFEVTQPEPTCN